jgi:protein involved in polysaccharide export with SLBB domain
VKYISQRLTVLTVLFTFIFLTTSNSQPPTASAQTASNLIHYGDLIDVDVVGSFEYDWRGTLTPEGFLAGTDKLSNQIYGLCRSEADVAATIAKEYAGTLRNPVVVVRILDRSNRALAFIDGAVKFPQRFQIRRRVLLNELLVLSGGITDRASGEVVIFRPASINCGPKAVSPGNGSGEAVPQTLTIRLSELLSGSAAANPLILSGDVLTVVEAAPVFVIGGVGSPTQISFRTDTTLSQAIARAGGLSKEGVADRIRIFRRDGKQNKIIQADLKKILAKQSDDPVLQAYDVIDVEQKGRGPAKLPAQFESELKPRAGVSNLPLRIVD